MQQFPDFAECIQLNVAKVRVQSDENGLEHVLLGVYVGLGTFGVVGS